MAVMAVVDMVAVVDSVPWASLHLTRESTRRVDGSEFRCSMTRLRSDFTRLKANRAIVMLQHGQISTLFCF